MFNSTYLLAVVVVQLAVAAAVVVVAVAAATPEIADWDWRLLRPQRLQPRLDFGISAVRKKKEIVRIFILF